MKLSAPYPAGCTKLLPRPLFLIIFLLFLISVSRPIRAQTTPGAQPVITATGELENARDPKCHATASRLEDFVFGTPLNFEARNKRIEFQQSLAEKIWLDYTGLSKGTPGGLDLFRQATAKYLKYEETDEGINVVFANGKKTAVDARDYRQYSTVAYALRAILSVQQSYLFEPETLTPLSDSVVKEFKKTIDLSVLSVLNEADGIARRANTPQIGKAQMEAAIARLFAAAKMVEARRAPAPAAESGGQAALLYGIIAQKIAAYDSYNHISQAVFLRNIQVYFSKMPWPTGAEGSESLKNYFTEAMIQFSTGLLDYAQTLAMQRGKTAIRYEDVYRAVQVFLPHSVNAFEDVTYFPNLGRQGQITIEAYDLDAFRDGGLHWQYLKFALDDFGPRLKIAPDPFALEMMVEGIAQFAVLAFRMGGIDAKAQRQEVLEIANIENALRAIQRKLDNYPANPPAAPEAKIISGGQDAANTLNEPFTEVSAEMDLIFEHRNSDWLSRLIRGYVVKEEENLARLAIPPAFGGGGVAAEDFDNDGWVDVLLLGGRGNQLLKNDGGRRFVNITEKAGLNWKRPDGNFGEPRQPIFADFDNDGWEDIFISFANDDHRIYRNRGDGTFEDMTEKAGLGGTGLVGGPCTALDYDHDGLLDLYTGYFGNYLKGELPTLKRHNTNGSPNMLFRNLGNFTFQNVSAGSGLENTGWTQAAGHAGIDGDGWQDIIVGNDFGVNAYYRNNRDGTFTDISADLGTDKPSYTMNVGTGDLNRDLHPDFYISNIVVMEKDDKYVLPNEDTPAHFDPASLRTMRVVEANDLFISSVDSSGGIVYTKSKDVGRGFAATGWSWDADFFDFDNDTDDDLYCLTGMNEYSVYGADNPYYDSPDGTAKEVTYAASHQEPNVFFENKNGILETVDSTNSLNYSGTSRSAAYFDMDNDGDLDIVVNDYQGSAKLFRNNAQILKNQWVKIKLVGDAAHNIPADAVGTAVVLTTPKGEQLWKEVLSTTGYLSGHPKTLHFGLGASTTFDLEIRWPGGHVQSLKNLPANKVHTIHYGEN
jgi:enediyne biosynthesis protein E4